MKRTSFAAAGIDEDLSFYEGDGEGINVAKIKEALKNESMKGVS
jgi:hypothetical protein